MLGLEQEVTALSRLKALQGHGQAGAQELRQTGTVLCALEPSAQQIREGGYICAPGSGAEVQEMNWPTVAHSGGARIQRQVRPTQRSGS